MLNSFYFIKKHVYIVRRAACACGPLTRVGMLGAEEGGWDVFLFLRPQGRRERGGAATPCCQTT